MAKHTNSSTGVLAALLGCFGSAGAVKEEAAEQTCGAAACSPATDLPSHIAKKAAAAGASGSGGSSGARPSGSADGASSSSCGAIPALYELPKRPSAATVDVLSLNAPSTSYPTTSLEEEWDVLGACMTTAQEMEACVDAVLDGSIKSAQALFARYDMDLDQRLRQQDFYDLCLELALALPYQEYARFVEASFAYADNDRDGCITLMDFVPLYKAIAAVRRAFKRQDHHNNGQIDRYDFYQLLLELSTSEEACINLQHQQQQQHQRQLAQERGQQQQQQEQLPQQEQQEQQQQRRQHSLQGLADTAFSIADTTGRGIVNFGQTLVWYATHQQASSLQLAPP